MRPSVNHVALIAVALIGVASQASAQKVLADGIKDLAAQIASKVTNEQKHRIAVLPFKELEGQPTVLGTFLAEELVTDLFDNPGLAIVERTMLDRIVGELKLDQSGLVDPETAKRVGKLAGVDAIVTGTITDLASYVAVNCRLIDAQSGRIFAAAQTRIVKDDDVRKIMVTSRAGRKDDSEGAQTGGSSPPSRSTAKPPFQREEKGFLVDLRACKLSGTDLACDLLITNRRQDRDLYIYYAQSRLFDEAGNEFASAGGFLGKDPGTSYSLSRLATEIPVRAQLNFHSVKPEMQTARLIELGLGADGGPFVIQFRNIPVLRP